MIETGEGDLSFWNGSFWDLWWQKMFRNIASVKYQWLFFLYVPTIYGMFNFKPGTTEPWISATLGLGFLGGGFVTLALGRLMANTKLKVDKAGQDINVHQQSVQRGAPSTVVMPEHMVNVDPYDNPANILDTER